MRVLEVLFEGERAVGVRVQDEDGSRARGAREGRRRRQRPELDDHGPARPARVGPGAEEGRPVDLLEGRLPRHRPATKGPRSSSRRRARRAGSGTSRCTTTSSASASSPAYDYLFKNRGDKDHETIYFEEVDRCPGAASRGSRTPRACDVFRAAKEYSYRSQQAAGDGWVLVGDAFGFLDPLYSSGVLLALTSGAMAADAIAEGLAKGDTSAAQLRQVGAGLHRAAWTACGGWCASSTTASASAASSSSTRT